MTILFDATRTVKPSRTARRFGAGITPPRTFQPTAADRAWWAAESERLENARFDAMAAESAFMDRHEAGMC